MGGYRKLGIITLIILGLFVIVICKINALVLKQLDETEPPQQPLPVEAPKEVKKEEVKPPEIIEGIVIEGPPPPAIIEEPPPASVKGRESLEALYEPSSDTPILVH